MEGETVRRRTNMIASHFVCNHDISPAAHLLPMNCSSSLNSAIPRRYDNIMYFARQASASQGFFMRQASADQMYKGKIEKPSLPKNSSAIEAPLFSRPAMMERKLPKIEECQPQLGDCKPSALPEPPNFARPNRSTSRKTQFYANKKLHSSEPKGNVWSPRMDVAESGCGFVLTVEIPGVNVNDIRVEVSKQNLRVIGKRTNQYCMTNCSNYSISAYHKREILQGPFQVVWPLPPMVNKDRVSAEFLNGILRIALPKL